MTEQIFDELGDSGQLAAIAQLLSAPPTMRRGWTELVKPSNPASGGGFTRATPNATFERLLSIAFTLVTSAAAGTRQLSLAYTDQDAYIFNLVPISNEVGPSQTFTGYGDLASVTPVQLPESHQSEGSVTTPSAGAAITSLTLPSGGWTLGWIISLAGTPAAADANNFAIKQGATTLVQSVNPGAVGGPWTQDPVEVQIPVGGQTVSVNAVGAGTSGAIYSAQLVAQPSGIFAAQFQIPDFTMRSGWQILLQLSSAQGGDQLSAIGMLLERYPSSLAAGLRV